MLTDGNGQESSNRGAQRGGMVSNGSSSSSRVAAQGGGAAPASSTTIASSNGTTHMVEVLNGSSSSQNGKEAARTHAPPPPDYMGHDREEVTRILLQALSDMGYHAAAESVSRDSGFELESPTVAAFRMAVLDGAWGRAEELLSGATLSGDRHQQQTERGNGLVLAPHADRNHMRVWLRQQKFLELLERRETARALIVLRTELTPLCVEQHQKLHFLSSLLMCQSPDDLKKKAAWDGAFGTSREILLSQLSRCISPSVMLPEHRLAMLLQQVKDNQIGQCLYHTSAEPPSLYSDHACDRSQFPHEMLVELDKHSSEVWQVRFSNDGSRLASCGMDRSVIIWRVPTFEVIHTIEASETGEVGNLAWSPDDKMLVSCGRDRYAKIWDTESGDLIRTVERFNEPVSSCVWTRDGSSLIIGTLDKDKSLCQWDLALDSVHVWTRKHRTEDLAISPDGQWLAAMDEQNRLHIYNVATREQEYELELKTRPTSVSISHDSRHLLVNKTDGEAQLIDIASRDVVQRYRGHSGGEFTIRSDFGGANESFVISGSEDGYVMVWHKATGIAVQRLDAHQPRCNSVAWNPADPTMFATCGDDNKIKIWSNKEQAQALGFINPNKTPSHPNGTTANSRGSSRNGWRAGEQSQQQQTEGQ